LGKDASMEDLVNDIEVISWKWFLARKKKGVLACITNGSPTLFFALFFSR